jgi:hypothetical protein
MLLYSAAKRTSEKFGFQALCVLWITSCAHAHETDVTALRFQCMLTCQTVAYSTCCRCCCCWMFCSCACRDAWVWAADSRALVIHFSSMSTCARLSGRLLGNTTFCHVPLASSHHCCVSGDSDSDSHCGCVRYGINIEYLCWCKPH